MSTASRSTILDDQGRYKAACRFSAALTVREAEKPMSSKRSRAGALFARSPSATAIRIAGATRRRSIYRATTQWFIGMDAPRATRGGSPRPGAKTLRQIALHAIANTTFYPSWGRARLAT